jgi:hypothetical protein
MTISFYVKEKNDIEEESMSIALVRKNKNSQSVNVKKLDNLTAVEQQTIKSVISIMEKYRKEDDSVDLKYKL